jgi:parvulin-like peptidyl-prolyl isomerase
MKYCFPLAGILVPAGLICAQQTAPPPKPLAIPSPSALPAPAPPPAPVISGDTVILTIGDEKITKAQFEEIMATLPEQQRAQLQAPGGKRKLAESLAELKALAQEGRARKIDQIPIVQAQIKIQVDQIIARNMYQELAKDQSSPITDVSLPPTEAVLHAYYDTHKADWDEVKAKHILIRYKGSSVPVRAGQKDLSDAEALAKASEIRAKIVAGAKFDDLAKTESDDTGNAAQGGDLGSFAKGRMVPQFDQAAFAAEVGKVTEPVKTQFGYHLILVESHATRTFEQAHGEIEQKIKQQQAADAQQRVQQHAQDALTALKGKKNIVYDDSYFGK